MTRLIGVRCTRSNAFSRDVLIVHSNIIFLSATLPFRGVVYSRTIFCSSVHREKHEALHLLVIYSNVSHLFPFRTEK